MHALCIDGFKVPAEKKHTHMIDMIHTIHACMRAYMHAHISHICMHTSHIHICAYTHTYRVSASTWIGRSSQMTFRARPLLVLACPLHQVIHTLTEMINTHARTVRRTDTHVHAHARARAHTHTHTHTHPTHTGIIMTPLSSMLEASNAGHMNPEPITTRWMRGITWRMAREVYLYISWHYLAHEVYLYVSWHYLAHISWQYLAHGP